MALQQLVQDDIRDINLLCNQNDKEEFKCGQCHQLALRAQQLTCDTKHHQQSLSLFCKKCAMSMKQSSNKCPVNQHDNPIFIADHRSEKKIEYTLQFKCIYSSQSGNVHGQHIDTMDEGKEQNEGSGCRWTGSYQQLKSHMQSCPFKPKEIELINEVKDDMKILKTKIDEMQQIIHDQKKAMQQMQRKYDKLEEDQKGNAGIQQQIGSLSDEWTQRHKDCKDDIQVMKPKIESVITQVDLMKNEMNISNEVPHHKSSSNKYLLYAVIILAIAFIAHVMWPLNNGGVLTQYVSTNNITVNNESVAIMPRGIADKISELEKNLAGYDASIDKLNDEITQDIKPRMQQISKSIKNLGKEFVAVKSSQNINSNTDRSASNTVASGDTAGSRMMNIWWWIRWISYYPVKFVLQFATEFALVMQAHCTYDELNIAVAAFGVGTTIIQFLYFRSIQGIIGCFGYVGAICTGMLFMREQKKQLYSKRSGSIEYQLYWIASFALAQIQLFYWIVWNGDDILMILPAILVTCFLMNEVANGRTPHVFGDSPNLWNYSPWCIITILLIIFFIRLFIIFIFIIILCCSKSSFSCPRATINYYCSI